MLTESEIKNFKRLSGLIIEELNTPLEPNRINSIVYISELEPILDKYGLTEILKTAYEYYNTHGEADMAELVKPFFNKVIKYTH